MSSISLKLLQSFQDNENSTTNNLPTINKPLHRKSIIFDCFSEIILSVFWKTIDWDFPLNDSELDREPVIELEVIFDSNASILLHFQIDYTHAFLMKRQLYVTIIAIKRILEGDNI